jgi:transcriptional regulator with XRE-family HTH domain
VKLGAVLKKERSLRNISTTDAASRLEVSEEMYLQIEDGQSPVERWGPLLAKIAVKLAVPTSRLVSETGKAAEARPGECGKLIKQHRERRNLSLAEMAALLALTEAEYAEIEMGNSPIEDCGPLLLRFAELINQPVFNLLYPCGVPLEKLTDYP